MTDVTAADPAPAQQAPALDPRREPFRPDLAAESLKGKVEAQRYAPGKPCQVIAPAAPLRRRPDVGAPLDTEALFGETLTVYDEADGWAWVQLARDRYVGYMPAEALSPEIIEPTHRVKAIGTFVYPEPDIKSPPLMVLALNALLAVTSDDAKFASLAQGGYVPSRHIAERRRNVLDFVEIAERLIGTPYLWGGCTRLGIDCSGLVQMSLEAAGIPCPRDSDMQEAELGHALKFDAGLEGLGRGDLIFWKGHVGIMSDGVMLLHANAHHMAVTVETLPEAVDRITKSGSAITSIRRL